jgi:hypothetical protein
MRSLFRNKLDGFVKSPSAALRLSTSRLRSRALTCLLGFTAFGRKPKPPASQVAVYASFVIATYRNVRLTPQDGALRFEERAPGGFKRGARLASGAFYFAVRLMTFYELIKLKRPLHNPLSGNYEFFGAPIRTKRTAHDSG